MPLARVVVRNEYGLGAPELYNAANGEDPKAILNGVAISGLVGILRQLGDLAEFASEVFHDLQEQVMATASRNHKMMVRVQQIEAALPPLEKAVMSQSSCIHFAYTTGSYWHHKIQTEQNHLIYSDLPQFIVDSYEECRDPPCLNLLDRFDSGGSGACMKRYSDPSFFKRVLASSVSTDADKVQRENKAHKSKKRGSRHRNGEISRVGSMPRHSGRMQFASPKIYGQRSAPETVSLFNVRSNSELHDRSSSFDSRNKSSFMESVFDGSSSMRTDNEGNNVFLTSRLKIQCTETLDSVLPEKQNGPAVDDLPHSSLKEQSTTNTSIATWDEKSEIVKSEIQQCDSIIDDQFEASELHPVSSGISKLGKETSILGYADSEDVLFIDVNMPKSVSVGNQFDEIESELDNYMDALNTMDSEVESDLECQTKREVDFTSNFENTQVECESAIMEKNGQNADSFDTEHCTASYSPLNKKMSQNSVNLIAVECLPHPEAPQITGMSCPSPDGPARTDFCENNDIPNVSRENGSGSESVSSDPSPSSIPNSHAPFGDKIESSLSNSQESHIETPSTSPNKFWTNGGLLGLEPSKPPDCSLSNVPSQTSLGDMNDGSCNVSRHGVMPISHSDESVGKLEKELDSVGGIFRSPNIVHTTEVHLVRNVENNMVQIINQSRSSKSGNDNQNDDDSRKKVPCESIVPETNLEKSEGSHHSISSHAPELPVAPVVKTPFDEVHRKNTESSSNMYDLGHRLLVNGFRRKASLDETSEPACLVKVGPVMLQDPLCNEQMKGKARVEHQTALETTPKEETDCESPENSPSSPPLGHMKISFHSINGFETSKLKLKFPDRSYFHENIRDVIFPSFQLLPEPSTPKQDIDSESDDDTFCRSSPCMPEDMLSHHSESSSEQWESGDSTGSKGHEVHDALHRVSSTESISASLELQGLIPSYPCCGLKDPVTENGLEHFHSSPSLDLPSFGVLNPLKNQHVSISNSVSKEFLQSQLKYPNETLAPPPPLPPLRWRTMKPHLAVVEDKQRENSEAANHPNDLLVPVSNNSQKFIPAPPKQPHIKERNEHPLNNKKVNKHTEVSQTTNVKEVDEREDLLYQIRTKQFSLRRTIPPRQSITPDPPTNVKVAAILKKANAIRQACVGSDEGEDEKWSDG
ncbi:protein SCAR3-like isoform X2 [Telopea speciosissima]|uniref:protein SCAR3-like isoform X2 n=1 Tax=Telopea speciosissima TaxID=54955 RepID=UPI001CC7A64C|nr:protein SCAR3-like isoform X2 [Telopea speciosissima]